MNEKNLYLQYLSRNGGYFILSWPAVKLTPKWWKKIPFLNDFKDNSRLGYGVDNNFLNDFKKSKNDLKSPTIKGCPAVLDSISSGYILRAWCDIVVSVNDIYEINVSEVPKFNDVYPEKGHPSYFDSQEMFTSQEIIKQKSIPKVYLHFMLKVILVSLLVTHPMYHFNQNWSTMPVLFVLINIQFNLNGCFTGLENQRIMLLNMELHFYKSYL